MEDIVKLKVTPEVDAELTKQALQAMRRTLTKSNKGRITGTLSPVEQLILDSAKTQLAIITSIHQGG